MLLLIKILKLILEITYRELSVQAMDILVEFYIIFLSKTKESPKMTGVDGTMTMVL